MDLWSSLDDHTYHAEESNLTDTDVESFFLLLPSYMANLVLILGISIFH